VATAIDRGPDGRARGCSVVGKGPDDTLTKVYVVPILGPAVAAPQARGMEVARAVDVRRSGVTPGEHAETIVNGA
jgi:hypothetical protein